MTCPAVGCASDEASRSTLTVVLEPNVLAGMPRTRPSERLTVADTATLEIAWLLDSRTSGVDVADAENVAETVGVRLAVGLLVRVRVAVKVGVAVGVGLPL